MPEKILGVAMLYITHNKRMQSDQNARYALILTADARRYAVAAKTEK